jgi:hypothetical protein
MQGLRRLVRQALFAALIAVPMSGLAEVAAQFDPVSGSTDKP